MSRFNPTEEAARQAVLAANERAERLALRIVNARHALRRGEPAEAVLSILDAAGGAVEPHQCDGENNWCDACEARERAAGGAS